jgi:hypothetical protein
MTVKRVGLLFVGTLVASSVSISACSSGGPSAAASTPPVPPATAATALPTVAPTTVAATTPPPAPVTRSYDAARVQWQDGATAISAEQGRFWSQAAADLTLGETTDSDPTGYVGAVTMLNQLIGLPDAQQTQAQNAEFHADINGLNAFFKTPGLYS